MPWWFWIILWTSLVVLSVAFIGFLLWKLVLKAADSYREFVKLNDSLAAVAERSGSIPKPLAPEKKSALFTPISEAYANYEQGKEDRTFERVSRRIQRRDLLGQPQNVGDLRIQARKGASHVR